MLRGLLGAVEQALAAGGPLALPDGHAELVAALAAYDGRATAPDAGPPSPPTGPSAERRQAERRQGERRHASESFVRVRTDRLDQLVDLVGELVIAHAMLAADAAVADGAAAADGHAPNAGAAAPLDAPLDPAARDALARKVAHAGKIVRELQELAIGLRTVPLRPTVQKLSRLVRDVAARLGKEVDFVTEGEDTEVDRAVADGLGDPLVHMLRNALDHGLEPPDARAAAGKPRRGRVRLAARHAGGAVVVELSDDGRGLDRERIARKAVERGLIESDRGMSDAEVHALIFAPGFSTAEVVTDLSGRGVGMDVVRRELERVRGRVDIASAAGQGTTFTVRLPLTLAVADGMLVRVGDERYVVPTANVHMSFRPAPGALQTVAGRGEVVTLRGDVLPVVRLHALFGVGGAERDPARAILMLVGDGARRAALLVDELLGQQQVVVKALGDGIGRVPGLAGGAILGDGRVGLILDVPEVVALAERGEALAAA
jgi:two-component system chemotaxis sensor kinase CheA